MNLHSKTVSKDDLLRSIEKKVIWLATNMVHYANHVRPNLDAIRVGGHQASSTSVATILTSLYFDFIDGGDKVSVKPHASPAFHAIQYLLGHLDGKYLARLREFGGLQAYPSRTKDPDFVDFSTGSVGIGSIAPNFAALVEEYLADHGLSGIRSRRRFVSVVGDAELDEGSIWEAVAEPALQKLKGLIWIIDLNRQSLDRVIPGIKVRSLRQMFAANGWMVVDVKYGSLLESAFLLPDGEHLRTCLDELSNDAYQRLLRVPSATLRHWLPSKCRQPQILSRFLERWGNNELAELFSNLGGHDFAALRNGFRLVESSDGPAVIFAYTHKGYRLPNIGHPHNHSALLTSEEMENLKTDLGIEPGDEFGGFSKNSEEGMLCTEMAKKLRVAHTPVANAGVVIPQSLNCEHEGSRSTQQTFGVVLTSLVREAPEIAARVVTLSPDVATSTNLGGWINKVGVWRRNSECESLPPETGKSGIRWLESRHGQHVELGVSENNLFMALGQFGLSHELFDQMLLPIGTLYDPFLRRGLDAFFYGAYSGSKFIVVGTPCGITLAPEGGAHQSIGTQSIGTEMPALDSYEPCFGQEFEWLFMHALDGLVSKRSSAYFRLSTKQVEQKMFPLPNNSMLTAKLRLQIIRGAYRIVDRSSEPGYDVDKSIVNLFACGALVPEAIHASDRLLQEGLFVNVINVTGPGPLYRDFQDERSYRRIGRKKISHLETLFSESEVRAPAVTLIDDHPHTLAWIGSALGTKVFPMGVTQFGQSGNSLDLYKDYGLDVDSICATCHRANQRANAKINAPVV